MSDKTPTPRMPQLQGNPIWFDLVTPDPSGAKSFYAGLFGWEWADVPMSGGSTYHMAIKEDANIAGMSGDSESDGIAGVWINNVYVEDAEEIVRRIEANGGGCCPVLTMLTDGVWPRPLRRRRGRCLVCGRA